MLNCLTLKILQCLGTLRPYNGRDVVILFSYICNKGYKSDLRAVLYLPFPVYTMINKQVKV